MSEDRNQAVQQLMSKAAELDQDTAIGVAGFSILAQRAGEQFRRTRNPDVLVSCLLTWFALTGLDKTQANNVMKMAFTKLQLQNSVVGGSI